MIPYLIPFKQVGDFLLEDNIANYLDIFAFDIDDYTSDKFSSSIHYTFYDPELTLFVTDRIIRAIGCYESLLFKGQNLIGLSLKEFMSIVGVNYISVDELDFEDDNIPQFIYEFEDIGLQVWEKGIDGKIVTIIVGGKNEEG